MTVLMEKALIRCTKKGIVVTKLLKMSQPFASNGHFLFSSYPDFQGYVRLSKVFTILTSYRSCAIHWVSLDCRFQIVHTNLSKPTSTAPHGSSHATIFSPPSFAIGVCAVSDPSSQNSTSSSPSRPTSSPSLLPSVPFLINLVNGVPSPNFLLRMSSKLDF